MAGHSKWANIRFKKERADAKKGKIISRCAKEIINAVKMGGPDPKANPRLRLAIEKARTENVSNEVIDRNIKKASSPDQSDFSDCTYELYGHGGVGIIVEGMTDNKNRFASEMRIATNKRGGTIAEPGAVAFNFDRKGVIQIPCEGVEEEKLFMAATEAGAEDFDSSDEFFIVTTDPSSLMQVKEAIEAAGFKCSDASFEMVPKLNIDCDEETAKANFALIEWLEGIDDVDSVFHNMSPPEE